MYAVAIQACAELCAGVIVLPLDARTRDALDVMGEAFRTSALGNAFHEIELMEIDAWEGRPNTYTTLHENATGDVAACVSYMCALDYASW